MGRVGWLQETLGRGLREQCFLALTYAALKEPSYVLGLGLPWEQTGRGSAS